MLSILSPSFLSLSLPSLLSSFVYSPPPFPLLHLLPSLPLFLPPPSPLQSFQMLRELSVSLTGRPAHGGSFTQHSSSSPLTKKPQEVEEEFTFDVKIDQGLSGKKSCTITVSLKDGTLRFCKAGEINGTKFDHHQVRTQ